jgi:hypothetical protein
MRPLAVQERAARWVDWLIALGLAGWAQYEIWVHPLFKGDDGIPGPRPINAALFVLITVPLAWRRRAPLTVVSIVAAAATVQAVFFDRSTQPSTQLWLAVLIALYSVAAHGQGRDALLGAALVAAGTLAIDIRHLAAGERTLAEVAGEWALFAVSGCWAAMYTAGGNGPTGSSSEPTSSSWTRRSRHAPRSPRNAPGSPVSCTTSWPTGSA